MFVEFKIPTLPELGEGTTSPGNRPRLSSHFSTTYMRTRSNLNNESSNLGVNKMKLTNTRQSKVKEHNNNITTNTEHIHPTCCLNPATPPPLSSPVSIMSICDDTFREDIFTMLPPADICSSMKTTKYWKIPTKKRLSRKEIHVPKHHSTISSALQEVFGLIRNESPYSIPQIVVGPGEHLLDGGLLLINQSNISIRGTVERDSKTGQVTKSLTKIIGRIRIESGVANVHLKDMKICNPRGAGIFCTGKGTTAYLTNCKISGCRGNGIYVRQGALCEMNECNVSNNDSTGIAAWDPKTTLTIKDTDIHTNQGDGANASTGANLSIVGKTRIRSNSGNCLRTLDNEASIVIADSSKCEGSQSGNIKSEEEAAAEMANEEDDDDDEEEDTMIVV
jgi:hypothetical protein